MADGSNLGGEWLQVQLPYSIAAAYFVIAPRQDGNRFLDRSASSFSLLGSVNGVTWYKLYTGTGVVWT